MRGIALLKLLVGKEPVGDAVIFRGFPSFLEAGIHQSVTSQPIPKGAEFERGRSAP